ncbi:MAG TPA: polyprenyl synthetase family protein [Patescibacteria group bacterium]|nr:polyprenyl synthetase family protein [Patescibacteria group bacterium]
MDDKYEKAFQILNYYKNLVYPKVLTYLTFPKLPKEFSVPPKYKKYLDHHLEITNDYSKRMGKYLRATVLLLTYQAMGGKINLGISTAAAMQLSEDWILVHDDFEDNSPERRGDKALHIKYSPPLAVNAGDSVINSMWAALLDNFELLSKDKAIKIMQEFDDILARTTLGQSVELSFIEENKTRLSDEDWYFIADGKTSYYTVAGPIRLGAILAGGKNSQLKLLTKFGKNLGRCFQLVDDILDVTSDFAGLKKQIGNDIYESKRTLILGHLMRNASTSDRKKIEKIINKPRSEKTSREVKFVLQKMNEYKSIDYARKKAIVYKIKAEQILKKDLDFLNVQPYRNNLETLMNFILERDR